MSEKFSNGTKPQTNKQTIPSIREANNHVYTRIFSDGPFVFIKNGYWQISSQLEKYMFVYITMCMYKGMTVTKVALGDMLAIGYSYRTVAPKLLKTLNGRALTWGHSNLLRRDLYREKKSWKENLNFVENHLNH